MSQVEHTSIERLEPSSDAEITERDVQIFRQGADPIQRPELHQICRQLGFTVIVHSCSAGVVSAETDEPWAFVQVTAFGAPEQAEGRLLSGLAYEVRGLD